MSLKNRFFSVLTVAIAVAGFSTFTLAQDTKTTTPDKSERHEKGEGHGEGHEGQGGGMMRMLHGLDLTDAQKTQIHSIMEANKPDPATREEMKTLWKAKEDGTLTAAQQDRLSTLKSQMKAVHEQILAVLTPDQRAKLEQRKQEEREEHQRDHQKTLGATTQKPTDN